MQDEYWFGEWLLNEMEKQKLTRNKLAVRSGINHVTIGYYLTFKRMPNLLTMQILLKALGKKIEIVDN